MQYLNTVPLDSTDCTTSDSYIDIYLYIRATAKPKMLLLQQQMLKQLETEGSIKTSCSTCNLQERIRTSRTYREQEKLEHEIK